MEYTIPRCYDSHTHLLGTGILQNGLRLFDLKDPSELARIELKPEYFRGDWLVGFGWDQYNFKDSKYPDKTDLDQIFPNFPVALSRVDGHATWLNSKALDLIGESGSSGILVELDKIRAETFIPAYSLEQIKYFLQQAIRYFNLQGFTHLRDMSGFYGQWQILQELDATNELTLYVDENFTCENIEDFERALSEVEKARAEESKHLSARGIKFYFDGALGSEGAFLSKNYMGTAARGLTLWPLDQVRQVITRTWQKNFEVSVHTIGDEAAHQVISVAHDIVKKDRVSGVLNIEHAEIMRPETMELLKDLDSVCHIQPCHWLSDRKWLKTKLGSLYEYAFPWKALSDRGIAIQWGSDSPIEQASVANNLRALTESPIEGIPKYPKDFLQPHSHRKSLWGDKCYSEFADGKAFKVVFDGKELNL